MLISQLARLTSPGAKGVALALARFLGVAAAAFAPMALADGPPAPDKGDTAWMMTSTLLLILMTIPGLALFYGGMVRSKNVLSVLMQVFIIFCLATVLWVVYGYR